MTISSLFEKQYRQYGPGVKNFIAKYVSNYSTAEDITHDVFIKAHKAAQGKTIENPRAYLFAAARNHLLNHFRRRANQQYDRTIEFDELIHGINNPSEEMRLEARNDLKNLITAIRTLPPRAQKAFILSRIYRFSYLEVGKRMGISPRTVENHVAKSLIICTRLMAKYNSAQNQSVESNITDLATHRDTIK